jgi:hypothetical protein
MLVKKRKKRKQRKKNQLLKIVLSGALFVASDDAFAAFMMTEVVSPSFGTFLGGASSRQFTLNTNGTITGADAGDYIMGAVGGALELDNNAKKKAKKKAKGKKKTSVNIVAENISTLGGLSVGAVLCKFDKDPQTTCSGPGINVTLKGRKNSLLLGVDVTTTQVHGGGDTASVSFDITVTFL